MRLEHWLLISFLLGILITIFLPIKIDLFPIVVDVFITGFMFFSPVIVFVIIFNSTCSLLHEREGAGEVIRSSVGLFALLGVGCSLLASIILSFLLPSTTIPTWFLEQTILQILQILLTSLCRPVTVALLLGITIAIGLSHASIFEKVVKFSKRIYAIQESAFKLLLKALPFITMSLGASLYYSLGNVSIEAYVIAMGLTTLLGLVALSILFVIVETITHGRVMNLAKYSARILITGLSIGSSYVILPLGLRIFKEHFNLGSGIGDLVVTLGASLNRCGSVMGVLAVTMIAAHYTGFEISWQQMLLLSIPVALIGFGSPGIQGGTILVAMPAILPIITPPDVAKFTTVAVALFAGGTTFIQAAVNTVASGYVALLVNGLTAKQNVAN
jgi:serine/threonine transporter